MLPYMIFCALEAISKLPPEAVAAKVDQAAHRCSTQSLTFISGAPGHSLVGAAWKIRT